MRVTMYSGDYEPIVVLDVPERDLETLRRGAGDDLQVVPRLGRMDYRMTASQVAQVTAHHRVRLVVEGMRFARRVAPILVVHGLRLTPEFVREGDLLSELGMSILHPALDAARRRTAPTSARNAAAATIGNVDRWRSSSLMNAEFNERFQEMRPRVANINPAAAWPSPATTASTPAAAPDPRADNAADIASDIFEGL